MEHAWVAATDKVKPQKGDIVKTTGEHVFVSLDFDKDGKWETVQGGQGGPKYESKEPYSLIEKESRDFVARIVRDAYDASKLEGWIDLELFVGTPSQPPGPNPAPQHTDRGATGRLWLNAHGEVVHRDAPIGGGGRGYFRCAGSLFADTFVDGLPHPWAPGTRRLDPLEVLEIRRDREEA
jgi:hypothetical protein